MCNLIHEDQVLGIYPASESTTCSSVRIQGLTLEEFKKICLQMGWIFSDDSVMCWGATPIPDRTVTAILAIYLVNARMSIFYSR